LRLPSQLSLLFGTETCDARQKLALEGGGMGYVPDIVIAGCIATVVTMVLGDWLEDRR
jgi:hypothetical protein